MREQDAESLPVSRQRGQNTALPIHLPLKPFNLVCALEEAASGGANGANYDASTVLGGPSVGIPHGRPSTDCRRRNLGSAIFTCALAGTGSVAVACPGGPGAGAGAGAQCHTQWHRQSTALSTERARHGAPRLGIGVPLASRFMHARRGASGHLRGPGTEGEGGTRPGSTVTAALTEVATECDGALAAVRVSAGPLAQAGRSGDRGV